MDAQIQTPDVINYHRNLYEKQPHKGKESTRMDLWMTVKHLKVSLKNTFGNIRTNGSAFLKRKRFRKKFALENGELTIDKQVDSGPKYVKRKSF